MKQQLQDIFGDDQFLAHRREARRLAIVLAGDVVAHHDTLKRAGIEGELLADLTRQFNQAWLGIDSSPTTATLAMWEVDE